MTVAQRSLYFCAWADCRKALVALGRDASDEARHALQAEALDGKKKSSTALTNGELDRVLAKFRSYSEPGDLNAQLKPEEDAEAKRSRMMERCEKASAVFITGDGPLVSLHRRNWLNAAARRAAGADFDHCMPDQLTKLAYILEARVRAKYKADAKEDAARAVAAGEATDRSNPF
ncbi:MAG: hypothetical protein RIQ79_2221 [Verrucomicrobiota bacterium]